MPGSSTTGGAALSQDGSLTPARPTGSGSAPVPAPAVGGGAVVDPVEDDTADGGPVDDTADAETTDAVPVGSASGPDVHAVSSAASDTAATSRRTLGDTHPPRPRSTMRPIVPVAGLVATLAVPGVAHFTHPAPFVAIVPRSLPSPELLVAVSGVAELACAALVAHPRTRRAGGLAAAALFAAVFPANVSMALRSRRRPGWYRAVVWARLPVQIPLIGYALRVSTL